MSLRFNHYEVEMTFQRDVLGTNSANPSVHNSFILDRERKLIEEKRAKVRDFNKYLDALPISQTKGDQELDQIVDNVENLLDMQFSAEMRKTLKTQGLDALKETISDLDLKGTTVFFWDKKTNRPCISTHMVKGFLKDAGEAICRTREKNKGQVLNSASFTTSLLNTHLTIVEQFVSFDRDIVRTADGKPEYCDRPKLTPIQGQMMSSLAKSEIVPAGAKVKFTVRVLDGSAITEEVLQQLFDYGQIGGIGQWRNAGHGQFSYTIKKLENS